MSFPDSKPPTNEFPGTGSSTGETDATALQINFDETDLETLRSELLQSGLDLWQAGELVSSFLAARGFGISAPDARSAASRIDSGSCTLECMRHELNRLALFM